jgi:hypothetical protein
MVGGIPLIADTELFRNGPISVGGWCGPRQQQVSIEEVYCLPEDKSRKLYVSAVTENIGMASRNK